ncbi:nuclear transport factor 2 family protein [Actinoallomurus sp. CA-150999]|uniref:nuclear transport factor 2 family protein n=1 Tax=Actinoallomurus sp. CA-150999 TaxID=3239887 RepID=UPI003D8A66AE
MDSPEPPVAPDRCPDCARLADIEAIKQLKARYFRHMDQQNWTEFGEVFARDAVVGGGPQQVVGRPAIVEYIAAMSQNARMAHQGFLPEIEVVGAGDATGTWAMSDYYETLGTTPPVGFRGFGHYVDRYAQEDGAWRITSSRLTRIKIIPLEGGLPAFYRRTDR